MFTPVRLSLCVYNDNIRMHTCNDAMVTVASSLSTVVPYEVTVTTGDVSEAGTDSKIFITVFGTKGSTAPIELEKNEDRFERARTDVIKVCIFYIF